VTPPVTLLFGRARRRTGPIGALAAALVMLSVTACGGPGATFDPAGPCVVDGRAAGAYPDLEALLPTSLDGRSPTSVDSGRSCTEAGLGSLATHDVAAVMFAGATWDLGDGSGVSSVVFATAGTELQAAWIAEFYETGARAGKKTSNIETSRPSFEGAGETWRLDALNDLSFQTVVSWGDAEIVRVVLIATKVAPDASRAAHDDLVAAAVRASVEAATTGG
jgi:hypothetical protein